MFFVVQMSAVLRYIFFYLEEIHEIRVVKLPVLAKVLDFVKASQQFCLED